MPTTRNFLSRIVGIFAACGLSVSAHAVAQVYTYQSTLGTTAVAGSDNTHFHSPFAGAVDPVNGHFFVADTLNHRVQVYDTTSLALVTTIGVTGVPGSDNAHFDDPVDVGYDAATGHIFVADASNQRIQVLDAKTFAYVATIGVTGAVGSDNAHFNLPHSARVGAGSHQLYVADYNNDRVQIFDARSLAYIATLGTSGVSGSDNNHLNQPYDADVNPATNQIMVADQGNSRVQPFDGSSYRYVSTLNITASNIPGGQDFHQPVAAEYDTSTNLVLVADSSQSNQVLIFDAMTYNYVGNIGTPGSWGPGNNQFDGPGAFSVDPAHSRLFVTDLGNQRVQVYSIAPVATHAALLPNSRSVQTGASATIYASMINSGTTALDNCQIALPATAPAGLSLTYQATNSATNALTGSPNTPVSIAGNDGLQTFVVTFTGSQAFNAPGMPLDFACAGAPPAAVVTGVDTVDLAVSTTPVPDIIALAAVAGGNGIAEMPEGQQGAFAVASINLGATSTITVSVDTGSATLPIAATLCQSDPSTGQCLAPAAASVTLSYPAKATPTFSIFLQSTGPVPFDPANSRVFVRFKDAGGGLHGSTSVAVETI